VTIHIEMRGRLEPVEIPGMDMEHALHALNMASVQGKHFVILEKADGKGIGIHTDNILTFEELDLEEELA
jgi:hypothetical protein